MTDQSHLYQRGTQTQRITTARLRPGNQVLTESTPARTRPAANKIHSVIRTVDRVEPFVPEPRDEDLGWNKRRRSGGRRTVVFTDGSVARNLAAHETLAILSASIQEA